MTTSARLTCAAILTAVAMPALADYPNQPVSFIVPWPPGDLEDVLTRMIADQMQTDHGVAAAVVNRPGGGGGPFPGAIDVANAKPDGYTVGSFVLDVALVGHEIGIPELSPEKFDPVGIFLNYPFILAAKGDAPYKTMAELVTYAKANPVAVGHFGIVTSPAQVTMAMAKTMDFEWGSDAAFDALDCNTLASGDADVINTTVQLVLPCLNDLTVLVALTDNRIPLLPDVPTIGELAPDIAMSSWNGLFVAKDTPQEVRDVLAAVTQKAMASERAQQLAKDTGAEVYWLDAKGSAERIARDKETLGRIMALIE
ncbi:MAG: tripartite tricarboxylate transporter substrate binding protein [Gemmobacter sp.]|nr:tripartite tricarboxylate transporter substrate binding protein [Gemmobacter sp.]